MTPHRSRPGSQTRQLGRIAPHRLLIAGCLPLLAGALLWLLAGLAHAADALPAFAGRLNSLQGDVRWYDRDSAGWLGSPQQPLRNWPLAAGDRLRTGPDGRAELRLGSSTLRLGANVDLTLRQLDNQGLVLWLQAGTVALRLAQPVLVDSRDTAAWVSVPTELQTAEGRWLAQAPGHYRFERQADARNDARNATTPPATLATTWRGELRFEGRGSALTIPAGRRADLWLDAAGGFTRFSWAGVQHDPFSDWVARDERQDDAPVSARYVPPGMTGWQDLDQHGDWLTDPDSGPVWQPRRVAAGWAPFQDGHWAWVAPWGWTWIDDSPWGFAPFHYGSWLVIQGRWSWSPGPRHERPRYAPVLGGWTVSPHPGHGLPHGSRPPPPHLVMPPHLRGGPVLGQPGPWPRGAVPAPVVVLPAPRVTLPERGWRDGDGRDGRDMRDGRDLRDSRDGRDGRDGRDAGRREPDRRSPDSRSPDNRSPDSRDGRPGREPRETRDNRDGRDNRDAQPAAQPGPVYRVQPSPEVGMEIGNPPPPQQPAAAPQPTRPPQAQPPAQPAAQPAAQAKPPQPPPPREGRRVAPEPVKTEAAAPAARAEHSDRQDKPERQDRSDRADRQDRPERGVAR